MTEPTTLEIVLNNARAIAILIAAVTAAIGSLVATYISLGNRRAISKVDAAARETKTAVAETKSQLVSIEVKVDGQLTKHIELMERLMVEKTTAALAKGTLAGKEEGTLAGVAQEKQAQADRNSTPTNGHTPMPVEIVNPEPVAVVVKAPTDETKP